MTEKCSQEKQLALWKKSDSVYIISVCERCIQIVELIGDSTASPINESKVHIV